MLYEFITVGIVGLGVLTVISKTGSKHGALDPIKSPIKGATFAGHIPIVSGAKLEDEMGGNYYDDLGGPVTFTSHSWFFELATPLNEALAFYASRITSYNVCYTKLLRGRTCLTTRGSTGSPGTSGEKAPPPFPA